jgi:D-alanyl-D-alanine carboxypeptidase/D-alanyl-D-alanine carboxypeptidase (penicillin-binding protein 5/6)
MALYRDFPQDTHYFATRQFMFRGQLVRGHNRLMDRYPGMDGLKTGFTDASGFNLASTAVRDGQRLFAVVMGGRTAASRDHLMARLLDDSFDHQQTPAILVAQAAGVGSSVTHRMLAALSPIGNAEAETVPVRQRHHRRGKRTLVASASCTPHRGVTCPHRNQAHHPAHAATTRLARRNGKQKKVTVASRHAELAKAP